MPLSLYDVSVGSFLRVTEAVTHFLEKGRKHLEETGQDPDAMLGERIHGDMLPFTFQIVSVAHHSAGAIAGVRAGEFRPPPPVELATYGACQAHVAEAEAALKALTPDEVNALEGREMAFVMGERRMPFPSAEAFLLSFSLPNLHFHATTAYDLLRSKGAPLGKGDYLRLRRPG
jgi:uncharacterized protein